MKIEQDLIHKSMYWVVWDDGVRSTDFYNKTWAKEHIQRLQEEIGGSTDSRMPLRATEKPAGALF